jgi:hypothetical protein
MIGDDCDLYASIKPVKTIRDAFSLQKRTSSTSDIKFLHFFVFLWVIFAPLDPSDQIYADLCGPGSTTLILLELLFGSSWLLFSLMKGLFMVVLLDVQFSCFFPFLVTYGANNPRDQFKNLFGICWCGYLVDG